MVWVKTSDDQPEKPAFLALGRDRWAGSGVWWAGLSYANRHLTDGFVPANALAGAGRLAARLVEVGLWKVVAGGYQIVDYLPNQPTRAEVEATREERQKAGRVGGIRSGEVRRSNREATGKHVASPGLEATANPAPVPVPVPGPVPDD